MSTINDLRKLADNAQTEADRLRALNAASGLDRQVIDAKVHYLDGQASAFRQAAFFVEMDERA